MAQNKLKWAPTVNAFSTTLNGAISDTDTTLTLNSVTGLQNKAGILVIDRQDSSGNDTPTKREYIYFTSMSVGGNSVTCPNASPDGRGQGGSTAQSHSDGAKVEAIMDVDQWNGLVDSYDVQHTDAGGHEAITSTTLGLSSNASIAGNVFIANRMQSLDALMSTASVAGKLTVANAALLSVASISDNAITGNSLATNAITLGYAENLTQINPGAGANTQYDISGLTTTVTVPAGGRRIKVTVQVPVIRTAATAPIQVILDIREGETILASISVLSSTTNTGSFGIVTYSAIPTAGSHTYKASCWCSSAGAIYIDGATTAPSFILAELI